MNQGTHNLWFHDWFYIVSLQKECYCNKQSVPLTTSSMPTSSKFWTGPVKTYQSLARWASKYFVLQNLIFQISSRLQWKTPQHFKRVISFMPFCSSELRFVIQDFTVSLCAPMNHVFTSCTFTASFNLKAFPALSLLLVKEPRVPIFVR